MAFVLYACTYYTRVLYEKNVLLMQTNDDLFGTFLIEVSLNIKRVPGSYIIRLCISLFTRALA